MHVIARKALIRFWNEHPESKNSLSRWFKALQKTDCKSFNELRATFPTADKVGDLIVFNIRGNTYRLIASVHFNRRKVYIRNILTHHDYNKGAWRP